MGQQLLPLLRSLSLSLLLCPKAAATALLHFLTAQQGVCVCLLCLCVECCAAASSANDFCCCLHCLRLRLRLRLLLLLLPCALCHFIILSCMMNSSPPACSHPSSTAPLNGSRCCCWLCLRLVAAVAGASAMRCLRCCCPVNGFLLVLIVCHGVKWFPSCDSPFPFSALPSLSPSPTQHLLLAIPFTCLCTWHSSSSSLHLGGPPAFLQFSLYSFSCTVLITVWHAVSLLLRLQRLLLAPIVLTACCCCCYCLLSLSGSLSPSLCGGYFYLAFCTIYSLWLLSRLLKQGQHFINTL